jgi:hypothetical protein
MSHKDSAAFRFANVQLTTGVRLHYAEQGDAVGHAVILLHGYTIHGFHSAVFYHPSLRLTALMP